MGSIQDGKWPDSATHSDEFERLNLLFADRLQCKFPWARSNVIGRFGSFCILVKWSQFKDEPHVHSSDMYMLESVHGFLCVCID